jgi:hypothetical protein
MWELPQIPNLAFLNLKENHQNLENFTVENLRKASFGIRVAFHQGQPYAYQIWLTDLLEIPKFLV